MSVEAFVAERARPTSLLRTRKEKKKFATFTFDGTGEKSSHLLEVFAVFFAESRFVFCDELLLLLSTVDPKAAGTHKVRARSTLGTRTNNFVVELFRLSPRSNAFEAEAVVAVGQNSEALLASILLPNDVEADAARFLLRPLDRERNFHFLFVSGDALRVVSLSLLRVVRIEAEFFAQLAQLTVGVGTGVVAAEATLHHVRTQRRGVVDGNPRDDFGIFDAVGIEDVGVRLGRMVGTEVLFECRHKDGSLRVEEAI